MNSNNNAICRVYDFYVSNEITLFEDSDSDEENEIEEGYQKKINAADILFTVQMFGLNEKGETYSIFIQDYKPFFYILVNDTWNEIIKKQFVKYIYATVLRSKYYKNSITSCKLVNKKTLYGFDYEKEQQFIMLEFSNIYVFNKVKNMWYETTKIEQPDGTIKEKYGLIKNGILFNETNIKLYETFIPPLLRFFHIKDISPSGWISIPLQFATICEDEYKRTTCDYEYIIPYNKIVALNDKETIVPYKICSFDIEASSSHGDFPVPVKSYKRLSTNIIDCIIRNSIIKNNFNKAFTIMILQAFGLITEYTKHTKNTEQNNILYNIDLVYPKQLNQSLENINLLIQTCLTISVEMNEKIDTSIITIESMFENMAMKYKKENNEDENNEDENNEEEDNEDENNEEEDIEYTENTENNKKKFMIDMLYNSKIDRNTKINNLTLILNSIFPQLEGDKITFIGSSMMKYGENIPYMKHCIALNTCDNVLNADIESYKTEKEVMLAWTNFIQRENPDIIIGYNIFGFDYEFMYYRAKELNCLTKFLELSRNLETVCSGEPSNGNGFRKKDDLPILQESKIVIASGEHILKYIPIIGRLQIDLYNYFRREVNLTSYKLDNVASSFISDDIKKLEYTTTQIQGIIQETTVITTKNMTGLEIGSYIHIEEIGYSSEYYKLGAKFNVIALNNITKQFTILGYIYPDLLKKIKWGLAKDDVTPKEIFALANGTSSDRAILAKYCIQDCNLVQHLFHKVDVLTGYIEMANINSVPISFLVMRGQGIKLTSCVSKECYYRNTLMPVVDRGDNEFNSNEEEGYEGATVLEPKCNLYLDIPIACVDYAGLYPSSMISENISHDSKVCTKEYNLQGNLIREYGEKDNFGRFKYDKLPNYELS